MTKNEAAEIATAAYRTMIRNNKWNDARARQARRTARQAVANFAEIAGLSHTDAAEIIREMATA